MRTNPSETPWEKGLTGDNEDTRCSWWQGRLVGYIVAYQETEKQNWDRTGM